MHRKHGLAAQHLLVLPLMGNEVLPKPLHDLHHDVDAAIPKYRLGVYYG